MIMDEKQKLVKQFFQLARKLGKMPTARETKRFICSSDKYNRVFESFEKFKTATVEAYPSLEEFIMPARLTTDDLETYRLTIQKGLQDKNNKAFVKKASAYDYVEHFSEQVFAGRITPNAIPKSTAPLNRALFLTLSDLHFGSDIWKTETGHENFGTLEESRRFAEIIRQTIQYKPQHRKNTELHVNLLGDIIKHKLHDAQDGAPMAEQVCRAIHLLSQGCALLGENFSKVTIHCATGNHGRDMARHPGRATSSKWDSVETVIYYALKSALQNYPNIKVEIPKTPFCKYKVFGHGVYCTHGDNVINPGNPGKSINVKKLEEQINTLNASMHHQDEIKLIFVGHVHTGSIINLNNGAKLVVNGALTPIDQFCVSIGIFEGSACQTLVEATAEYALGDIRFLQVGTKQDKDASLDKIIKPWTGF